MNYILFIMALGSFFSTQPAQESTCLNPFLPIPDSDNPEEKALWTFLAKSPILDEKKEAVVQNTFSAEYQAYLLAHGLELLPLVRTR